MCLIVDLQPGAVIPEADLKLACEINKQGFGIAVVQNNTVATIRSIEQPNNHVEIQKHLHKLKNRRVFLHLRHATVGDVIEKNSHPLVVLNKAEHGRDLVMMHNGTLWDFDPKDVDKSLSDSAWFVDKLARPLALRWLSASPKDSFLNDEIFSTVLCKFVLGMNKLVFLDNLGGVLFLNKHQGKEFPGYWASNDYSFDTAHHRVSNGAYGGSKYTPSYLTKSYDGEYDYSGGIYSSKKAADTGDIALPWEREELALKSDEWKWLPTSPVVPSADDNYKSGYSAWRNKVVESKRPGMEQTPVEVKYLYSRRVPFVEMAGLEALLDIGLLSRTQLIDLCSNFPEAAAEAIIDLLVAIAKERQ